MASRIRTLVAVAAAVVWAAGSAQAAVVTCPNPAEGGRDFNVEITTGTGGAFCYDSGTGNNDPQPGYVLIDKDEDPDAIFPDEDALTLTGLGGTSGTFSIAAYLWGIYDEILLTLKVGANQGNTTAEPDWVTFRLTPVVLAGNWSITANAGADGNVLQGLSHMQIEGRLGTVPEPASVLLFGLGLLGVARAARSRFSLRA